MTNWRDIDKHAKQMNPNNDVYWESQRYDGRPDDWEWQTSHNAQDDNFGDGDYDER